jgi:hypothetical protein
MSDHAQHISIYCTSLETFLERVHQPSTRLPRFLRLCRLGGQTPTAYLQCLVYQPLQTQGWPPSLFPCYLGVLITARVRDEVLSLWMLAGKVYPPSPAARKQLVQARQTRLGELLTEALSASGVRVIADARYHVPESALQQIAPLCATWKAALEAVHLPESALAAEAAVTSAPKGGRS